MKAGAIIKKAVGAGGILILSLSMVACSSSTKNLMAGIYAKEPQTQKRSNDSYIDSTAEFSVKMFQQMAKDDTSMMVSPVSVLAAMSMVANGAKNDTLKQINEVLYSSQDTEASINGLNSWLNKMEEKSNRTFSSANSIWVKNDSDQFTPDKQFLQKNADTLNAQIYSSDFGPDTVEAMNRWVKQKTNGMIEKFIDRIDQQSVLQLLNAVAFEDKWKEPYEIEDITDGSFTAADGSEKYAKYLCSTEDKYIETKTAVGLIKPYSHGYSFVAILPNEGVSLNDYIKTMSGKGLLQIIQEAQDTKVDCEIPKFKTENTMELNEILENMGIRDAFNLGKADFSGMGTSKSGKLYINRVLHKTFIEVNEQGTKASAVTGIMMDSGAAVYPEDKRVALTRPFLYMIIDDATSLPIFMGTVTDI